MDQSEHRTRWPQGQRVANGGSVGNSLVLGPMAPTPNRTQVHSRFNSLDLRWQRRVHVRHCYPPRELANGEFETRFCNVCPIWRWPDIGGNARMTLSPMTRQDVPPLLTLSGAVLEAQWDRVGHITLSDRCRRPVGRERKKKTHVSFFGTRTIGGLIGTRGDLSREEELLRQNSESMSQIGSSESHDDGQSESQFSRRAYPGQPAHGTRRQGARRWFHAGPEHVHSC